MPTEEQNKETEARIAEFKSEYDALCSKHQVRHAGMPQYLQMSNGVYVTTLAIDVIDTKYRPVPSPFQK